MAKKDNITHKKVKGTEMVFRSLSLPAALVENLKLLRKTYEDTWYPQGKKKRVTYEKVLERLLSKSGLGHVDPDVYAAYLAARGSRTEYTDVVTRATRKSAQKESKPGQGNVPVEKQTPGVAASPADPTKGDVWDTTYYFKKGGERIEARIGDLAPFYAEVLVNGAKKKIGISTMLADGWTLVNGHGVEIKSVQEAKKINELIKNHNKSI